MNAYAKPTRTDFASRRGVRESDDSAARKRRNRLALVKLLSLAWALLIVGRLYSLQLADFEIWQSWASRQHEGELSIASERGPVLDRNNTILTVSVPAGSVYIRPKLIKAEDRAEVLEVLSQTLELEPSTVEQKLNSRSPFVWVKRQVPKHVAEQIDEFSLSGVGFFLEARRFYPYGFAASNLLGRVGTDGNGLSGLEAAYESRLKGNGVKARVTKDALGNTLRSVNHIKDFELPKGQALKLTIDASIQMILDQELEAGRRKANAKSAMAVMVDADTGEIIAMSQAPLINFNEDVSVKKEHLKNKIVETVFEPGSIMKPLVTAAAIEMGAVSATDMFDCENGYYLYGGRSIKDVHGSGVISVHDIVVRSSNIGMTKIGNTLGPERLYQSLKAYGFGSLVDLRLPGQTSGIFRHYDRWSKVDVATHSFGQGIAVTPLQIVRAISAIANGGYLPSIELVENQKEEKRVRILSEKTTETVREMMYGVVEDDHGTARRARMKSVRVGGKTGTAQKARKDGRGYDPGAYIASFVGFVDGSSLGVEQKLVLAVIIDEPNTTSIYGGTLAAPVFKRVMQKSLHHLSTASGLKGEFESNFTKSFGAPVKEKSDPFMTIAYKAGR